MAFYLLNMLTDSPYVDSYTGEALLFENAEQANGAASEINQEHGSKIVQIRKQSESMNLEWQKREQARFENGEYEKPEWLKAYGIEPPALHFVHIAKKDKTKIAYTQNFDKGANDIQSVMRVSAYLEKYFSTRFSESERISIEQAHIRVHGSFEKLEFTSESSEIAKIYMACHSESTNHGIKMQSCMTHSKEAFCTNGIHPTEVYGGDSDLSLAYVKDENGAFIGRSIVWLAARSYARAYGSAIFTSEQMASLLQKNGFRRSSMHGAKIRKLTHSRTGNFILPYLDCSHFVKDSGSHFVICEESEAEYIGGSTNGMAQAYQNDESESFYCERCEDSYDSEESYEVFTSRRHTQLWCYHCQNDHSFWCSSTNNRISYDSCIHVDGEPIASWYAEENSRYCDFSEEYTFASVVSVFCFTKAWHSDSYFLEERYCSIDRLNDFEIFACRITQNYWTKEFIVYDSWCEEPRSICSLPNDVPENFKGTFAYHSYDSKQFEFNISFAA